MVLEQENNLKAIDWPNNLWCSTQKWATHTQQQVYYSYVSWCSNGLPARPSRFRKECVRVQVLLTPSLRSQTFYHTHKNQLILVSLIVILTATDYPYTNMCILWISDDKMQRFMHDWKMVIIKRGCVNSTRTAPVMSRTLRASKKDIISLTSANYRIELSQ